MPQNYKGRLRKPSKTSSLTATGVSAMMTNFPTDCWYHVRNVSSVRLLVFCGRHDRVRVVLAATWGQRPINLPAVANPSLAVPKALTLVDGGATYRLSVEDIYIYIMIRKGGDCHSRTTLDNGIFDEQVRGRSEGLRRESAASTLQISSYMLAFLA